MKLTVLFLLFFSLAANALENNEHLANLRKANAIAQKLLSAPIRSVNPATTKLSAAFIRGGRF